MSKVTIFIGAILLFLLGFLSSKFFTSQQNVTSQQSPLVVEEKPPLQEKIEPVAKKSDDTRKKRHHVYEVNGKKIEVTVPEVPQAIEVAQSENLSQLRSIKFSKRIPPGWEAHSFNKKKEKRDNTTEDGNLGLVHNGQVSTYLHGNLLSEEKAKSKLENAGFKILTSVALHNQEIVSIVFTNDELLALASKNNRGFAATLRLVIDNQGKRISITNPIYMLKGMMQDDYNEETPKALLSSITGEFSGLKNSEDKLKFQKLPNYQFMTGLPDYDDTKTVANGANLLGNIQNNPQVLFTQKLNHGATLLGVKLSQSTNDFTKIIGTSGAGSLPYLVLIENNKAKILNPKYYLAYMYPRLKMSQFMKIVSVPGEITSDCEQVFN